MRVYCDFNGVQSQSCITMAVQSTGESLMSLALASMVYNYEMEESKRISGSQMPHSTEEASNDGGGKAGT